jgi:hypothetical protein
VGGCYRHQLPIEQNGNLKAEKEKREKGKRRKEGKKIKEKKNPANVRDI